MLGLLAACVAAPAQAAIKTQALEWKDGGTTFAGYLVYDDAGPAARPGLVVVPNWMGVNDAALEKAKALAGRDYVVLLADVYGKGVRPKDTEQAGQLSGVLMQKDRAALRSRVRAAVATLRAQAGKAPLDPARIGAVGFCFGGSAVLELVRGGDRLAGVVTLHGVLTTPAPAAAHSVNTPVLVLNGAADSYVSADSIAAFQREMDAGDADWQFVDFSGAVHCFAEPDADSPPGCVYNQRAARRAYRMLRDFFAERFAAGG
ncbi:MAG: dienelactone hydrolase family protein [Pseudoxanthomonas sp.]